MVVAALWHKIATCERIATIDRAWVTVVATDSNVSTGAIAIDDVFGASIAIVAVHTPARRGGAAAANRRRHTVTRCRVAILADWAHNRLESTARCAVAAVVRAAVAIIACYELVDTMPIAENVCCASVVVVAIDGY